MSFSIFPPCAPLRPYVRSFSIQETTEPATYKVLPDTSIVMGFQYKGRVAVVDQSTSPSLTPPATLLSTAGITGLLDSYRFFSNTADTGTVLVRFTPTGAAHFFTTPLHELFNGSFSLTDLPLSSSLTVAEQQLAEAPTNLQRITIIQNWLLSCLLPKPADTLIIEAIARIHNKGGQLRIANLSKELYISQSQFEKRFRRTVGTTAKKFASLVRLQQIIQKGPSTKDLTSLSYEAGYFDQSHFIHDFTTFTGSTPSDFFHLPA